VKPGPGKADIKQRLLLAAIVVEVLVLVFAGLTSLGAGLWLQDPMTLGVLLWVALHLMVGVVIVAGLLCLLVAGVWAMAVGRMPALLGGSQVSRRLGALLALLVLGTTLILAVVLYL